MSRVRRFVLGGLLVLLGLGVLLVLLVICLPAGGAPMPETIWIRGAESVMDRDVGPSDVRVGTVDGPEFRDARCVSAWSGGWSPSDGEGISFRRAITERQRLKLRLAKVGIVPRFRVYGAGYESTGQTVERDGTLWREFRLFNRRFNSTGIGWWRW